MSSITDTVRSWGIGGLIALIVLILCIVFFASDKPLTTRETLIILAALAASRLL